jgi:hypothetical protein
MATRLDSHGRLSTRPSPTQDKPEVAEGTRMMPRYPRVGGRKRALALGTARTGADREWRVLEALDPSDVGLPFDRRGKGTSG